MKRYVVAFVFMMILVSSAYAGALDNHQTKAEESGWTKGSTSQETVDDVKLFAANSGGRIRYEDMGYTVYGRPLPLAIVGIPSAPKSPAEVGDRIVIHIQCNIHSGEIEGKEASLLILREIAQGKHDELLKDVVLLYNSNFNPDGNDFLGTWRATTQPSPEFVGTRTNAQGFNLNRDFIKLDSPEARAHVKLWRKWNPAVVIDEHATDGTRHRHPINYNFGLNPNTDQDFKDFNRLLAESIFGVGIGPNTDPANNYFQNYMKKVLVDDPSLVNGRPPLTESVRATPYMESYSGTAVSTVNGVYERRPIAFEAGGSDSVRTTTAMPTVKNRIALLFECHSHNHYRYRVHTQYAATISAIEHISKQKEAIFNFLKFKDNEAVNRTSPAGWSIYPIHNGTPVSDDYDLGFGKGLITIEGYAYEKDTSGDRTVNVIDPSEDRTWENLECRTKFLPRTEVPMGALYILDPAAQSSVEVLMLHGVQVYRLTKDVTLPAASTLKFYNPADSRGNWRVAKASQGYEGHVTVTVSSGDWNPVAASGHLVTKGHYVISTAQRLGKFAAFLLEPTSDDGLCYWGFWDLQLFSTENNASGSFDIVKTSSYSLIPASDLELLVLPEDEEQAPQLVEDEIPGIFAGGNPPAGSSIEQNDLSDGTTRYYYVPGDGFTNSGTILDGSALAEGWVIGGVDPYIGTNWELSIVDNKVVATFTGKVDNAEAALTLLRYHNPPSNEVEVRTLWVSFSGDVEPTKPAAKKSSGSGCDISYLAYGLLVIVPFFAYRKMKK